MVAVTANYMVLPRSFPPPSFPPMINETASVIGYALNADIAEKAGGRHGTAAGKLPAPRLAISSAAFSRTVRCNLRHRTAM